MVAHPIRRRDHVVSREAFIRMFQPEPWRAHAACIGVPTEVFYPSPKARSDASFAEARSYCDRCPVSRECREAGQMEPDGVWGGVPAFVRAGGRTDQRCGRGFRTPDGHGSEAGYVTHRRNGEAPCDLCLEAARAQWRLRQQRKSS